MSTAVDRELLKSLTLAFGPPGAEGEVRKVVREHLQKSCEFSYDNLGSIICEHKGESSGPRVVLDGHMDEVGFMVQAIDPKGRLQFVTLGGWWGHVLLAQRVCVLTDAGEKIHGVIGSKPPHFLAPAERQKVLGVENMYIDLGAKSREEVVAMGIQLGDPIVPYTEFIEFAGGDVLSCKAFDNRAGMGMMVESMKALAKSDHPNTVIGVGAAQEEVGCRGAKTASHITQPDVAIVLEGTPADDIPGYSIQQGAMGKGPQLRFMDPTALSNRRLVRFTEKVAKDNDIPFQLAVRRNGGTNASSIHVHGAGVPTIVIGVPARHIHTHVSLIQWQDYVSCVDLVVALTKALDQKAVDQLTAFDED